MSQSVRTKLARLSNELREANSNLDGLLQSAGREELENTLVQDLWAARATIKSLERAGRDKDIQIAKMEEDLAAHERDFSFVPPLAHEQLMGSFESHQIYEKMSAELAETKEALCQLQQGLNNSHGGAPVDMSKHKLDELLRTEFTKLQQQGVEPTGKKRKFAQQKKSTVVDSAAGWVRAVAEKRKEQAIKSMAPDCRVNVKRALGTVASPSHETRGRSPRAGSDSRSEDLWHCVSKMGKIRRFGEGTQEIASDGKILFEQVVEFHEGLCTFQVEAEQRVSIHKVTVERHSWQRPNPARPKSARTSSTKGSFTPRPPNAPNMLTTTHLGGHNFQVAESPDKELQYSSISEDDEDLDDIPLVAPKSDEPSPCPQTMRSEFRGPRLFNTSEPSAKITRSASHTASPRVPSLVLNTSKPDANSGITRANSEPITARGTPNLQPPTNTNASRPAPAVPSLALNMPKLEAQASLPMETPRAHHPEPPLTARPNPPFESTSASTAPAKPVMGLNLSGLSNPDPAPTNRTVETPSKEAAKEDEDDFRETESARKMRKLALFRTQCSRIEPWLYIGGEAVAKDLSVLQQNNITHILNCAATLIECPHEGITYHELPLMDDPMEQIDRYFYPVLEMLESVKESGKSILVHCHQGVSRSCTFIVAYLMWNRGLSYSQALHSVREARGICQPNNGFTCQLLEWQRRLEVDFTPKASTFSGSSVHPTRLYLVQPDPERDHSDSFKHAARLVGGFGYPSQLNSAIGSRELAPNTAIVLHTPTAIHIWAHTQCDKSIMQSAARQASYLCKFEQASQPIHQVDPQNQTHKFWTEWCAAHTEIIGEKAS